MALNYRTGFKCHPSSFYQRESSLSRKVCIDDNHKKLYANKSQYILSGWTRSIDSHIFLNKKSFFGNIHKSQDKSNFSLSASLTDALIATSLFISPSVLFGIYAYFRGKGDLKHGVSEVVKDISQGYFQMELGGPDIPICDGEMKDLVSDEPLFCFLYKWFIKLGSVWKLEFGPKAFLVVSDPVVARYILKENMMNYDKGLLAEILEPIMGKGLIPADLETWKVRRRAIVPAFHQQFLNAMINTFSKCTVESIRKLNDKIKDGNDVINMESEFLSLSLDIIGLGVFNYDFGSITKESPVIQAVYSVLKEAEHRSTFYIPYWNIPLANSLVPRLRRFNSNLQILNDCLDYLITMAKESAQLDDIEALQSRDYSKVKDPSLLRFLADMRGEDRSNSQLRDDLMTFLIAGHETTAAVLTWALFLLIQSPEWEKKAIDEIDTVLGDSIPDMAKIRGLVNVRLILAESLRLYPQPPLLIRRALSPDNIPAGYENPEKTYPIGKGADLFICTWNLHRSPYLWEDPVTFNPGRFLKEYKNGEKNMGSVKGGQWAGYMPGSEGNSLFPNEVSSDFAFLPFGGGGRKCVGDQFASLEAVVCFSMLLKNFKFELIGSASDVKMATGATIHTADGLKVRVKRRIDVKSEIQENLKILTN